MTCGFIKIIGSIFLKFLVYLGIYRAFWAFLTLVCENFSHQTSASQPPPCEHDYKPIRQPKEQKITIDEPRVVPQELYADEPQNVDEAIAEEVKDDAQTSTPKPPVRKRQDYKRIKSLCLRKKILFEDPEFPADLYKSVFIDEKGRAEVENDVLANEPTVNWEWRRPLLRDNPQFYGDGPPHQISISQGYMGDCWFIAAVSSLAMYPELLYRVAPPQYFDENYAGIFHFQFWQYGEWVDVVVDDRLLHVNGKLAFAKSAFDEYAYPLLEKAYAKLYGAYMNLNGSFGTEAFVDLTGGIVHMYFNINPKTSQTFFKNLLKSYEMDALMCCGKQPIADEKEAITREGLVAGHVYSITSVAEVLVQQPDEYGNVNTYVESLIRLRNPWGNQEWNGRWCDGAGEWNWISQETRERLNVIRQQDGEFWMSFLEFTLHYQHVEIVDLTPDSFFNSRMRPWSHFTIHSEWTRGVSAGGCGHSELNPHILFTITDPEKIFEDGKCMVSISLMQKHRRYFFGTSHLFISFELFHVPPKYRNIVPLPQKFFAKHKTIYHAPYQGSRDVGERFRLPPGTYLIVPSTYDPDLEAQFLVRVFTSGHLVMRENDQKLAIVIPKGKLEDLQNEEQIQLYQNMFKQFDQNKIGWKQLKTVMDYFGSTVPHFKGFDKETVRTAIAIVDEDQDGKIEDYEFDSLIYRLMGMKTLFEQNDQNKTGRIPASCMQDIILTLANEYCTFGVEMNQAFLKLICHRFGKDDGSFSFDDFILCLIRIQIATEAFEAAKDADKRKAKVNFEEWLEVQLLT